jgi:hypothetical protein
MVHPRRSGEGTPTPGARTAEHGAPGNRILRFYANFLERRACELRRITLPRTPLNMANGKGRGTQPRPRSGGTFIRSGATSPFAQASRLARLAIVGAQTIA